MTRLSTAAWCLGVGLILISPWKTSAAEPAQITLTPIGTYATGLFDQGGTEIVVYHPGTRRLFSVNGGEGRIDVVSLADPTKPRLVSYIPLAPFGKAANSVAVHGDVVAAAVEANVKTDPGKAVFFNPDGKLLAAVTVGALPDMITFTPDGKKVLVANEGEPNDDYSVDPEGTVSIIDLHAGAGNIKPSDVATADFQKFNGSKLDASARVFSPRASAAQDFEPEYIAVAPDSKTAYVALQENNALAVVDVDAAKVTRIVGLGFKDYAAPGAGIDASDKDDRIRIRNWPVFGMYQPDSIKCFTAGGKLFIASANEGDSRDYSGFSEEARVEDVRLDAQAFPNAEDLQKSKNLGRLKITNTLGDSDNDGDFDRLYSFGARSFSIWSDEGRQVFDSGDQFEQQIARMAPNTYNSDNDDNDSLDERSDDKGPEPEALTIAPLGDRTLAFIGLERVGGVMVYDITDPAAARFVSYANNRKLDVSAQSPAAGDLGPECLEFIPASLSPNGKPLLISANEVSGTITVLRIDQR